jgi:hypothetical protein
MASLDTLPVELLCQIHGYIKRDRPALVSLSLVSKHLRAIFVSFLFHTVTVFDSEEDDLLKVPEIPDIVTRHIRHLIIENILPYGRVARRTKVRDQWPPEDPYRLGSYFYSSNQGRWRSAGNPPTDGKDKNLAKSVGPLAEQDHKSILVADLVKKIPVLYDLTYTSSRELPPCILDTLHIKHPSCRLHISHFSVYCNGKNPKLTEHQISLITSPCLHSITCSTQGRPHFMQALLDLVTGLSPNLRSVHILDFFNPILAPSSIPPPPWQGYKFDNKMRTKRKAALERLVIGGWEMFSWVGAIDTSKLRNLDLFARVDLSILRLLVACDFSSLENLGIRFRNQVLPEDLNEEFDLLASDFICSLSRLSKLELEGDIIRSVFDHILAVKGEQLTVLHIYPLKSTPIWQNQRQRAKAVIFDEEDLQMVKELCPNLEEFCHR